MIQRIQSVYLFLVAVCAVVCLCMPVGHFHQDGIGVADFYNLWLTMADGARVFAPWAMFVLLVLAAFTSFAAIFLFKRRCACLCSAALSWWATISCSGFSFTCLNPVMMLISPFPGQRPFRR